MSEPLAPVSATAEPSPWFGQPRGLTVLFLTNMWEQFSYYGMRALLVYYMTKQLLLSQGTSSFIYGAYTAGAYFTPIFGGIIADRFLGKRRAIIIGASTMAAGHFMMAFEPLFYVALATIALGNGLFLPSLPSQVGDLYERRDPRRGWAFNVYYVGINIGGFLAPLICGTVGELYGWHYGFGIAGVGMLGGLLIYLSGQKYLPPEPPRVTKTRQSARSSGFNRWTLFMPISVTVIVSRVAYERFGNTVTLWADVGIVSLCVVAGLLIYLSRDRTQSREQPLAAASHQSAQSDGFDRRTLLVLIGIGVAVTVFRSAYEQVGNTVALWADTGVDRAAGAFEIPMTWFQSLNPLFVMLMTPPLLRYWRLRAERLGDTTPLKRMAQGALLVAVAYLMLAGIEFTNGGARASWLWLAGFFVIFTFGELFILPTGLGLFARLAPVTLGATTVAAWFLITFSGSLSAGLVGTLWSKLDHGLFFVLLAALAATAALLLRLLSAPTEAVEQSRRETLENG